MGFLRRESLHERLAREGGLTESAGVPTAWAEGGIHGVQRAREWDLVTTAAAPEIQGDAVNFVALGDGTLLVEEEQGDATVEPLATAIEQKLEPPYRARGARQTDVLWAVSARRIETARFEAEGERIELFKVQVMGGIVLHEGDIAEMKTGEGKTLVATQPLYLNALAGNGVHLVTVNDYLAKRDAGWMGPVYEKLGMRATFIENMMPFAERKEAYDVDITYGTNSEFGFDYLRDNMAVGLDGIVQRGHSYAIVDEVDSILIDEARTPLIISGEPETAAKIYYDFARVAKALNAVPHDPHQKGEHPDADYEYDEKHKTIAPTQSGVAKFERALGIENLYDPRHSQLVNHMIQALKAQSLYHRDDEYVIQDGEVKIVDEFTGRILEGRRWSEGLHQAVEAKEGVRIKE